MSDTDIYLTLFILQASN